MVPGLGRSAGVSGASGGRWAARRRRRGGPGAGGCDAGGADAHPRADCAGQGPGWVVRAGRALSECTFYVRVQAECAIDPEATEGQREFASGQIVATLGSLPDPVAVGRLADALAPEW